ncbi:response regulator [Kovacikia minuta CCNUW1]|uniref:response regulator n=1 Tax=Kovacikia minuta TaxID=2931930 RepID=UPI001CCB5204|nr:response regulator [Kovacikia minuta]UBF24924.1 response regulator [Kovacikia minuta CCNUW1]
MRLLIIEDDQDAVAALVSFLSAQLFTIDAAHNAKSALALVETSQYDLIVLDVMLPGLDGISLCRQLRTQNQRVPILLLTAKDDPADRVAGFEAGADDYVTKPYERSELLARIRALLRRGDTELTEELCWGELQLDPNHCQVTYQSKPLHLTPKEYKLLELFLRHPRRIFDRQTLLDRIWSLDECPGEEAVTTQIRGLRRKLQMAGLTADPIETLYGLGYRLRSLPEERQDDEEMRKEGNGTLHSQPAPSQPDHAQSAPSQSDSTSGMDADYTAAVATIQQMWQGFQERLQEQLATLEQAIAHLTTNSLDPNQRQHAQTIAHRLIGSLGAFGIPHAAELARQIERVLNSSTAVLQSESAVQLETLLQQLRCITQQSPMFAAPSSEGAWTRGHGDTEIEDDTEAGRYGDTGNQEVLAASPRPPLTASSVFMIDDDPTMLESMQAEAPHWAVQLETASDLITARERLQSLMPNAVVLDLTFSNTTESGLTLLAQLKRQFPTIPVVVLSRQGDLSKRVEVARLGVNAFLQKPVMPSQVFQVVTQLLNPIAAIAAKLLIVDDDPVLLTRLQANLEPRGFQVTALADPTLFWQCLEVTCPDLLLLDVSMPGFNGIELCQAVKSDPHWSQLPVLFLSAHADANTLHQALAVGADDYVLKPIVEANLIQRILKRLGQLSDSFTVAKSRP